MKVVGGKGRQSKELETIKSRMNQFRWEKFFLSQASLTFPANDNNKTMNMTTSEKKSHNPTIAQKEKLCDCLSN